MTYVCNLKMGKNELKNRVVADSQCRSYNMKLGKKPAEKSN